MSAPAAQGAQGAAGCTESEGYAMEAGQGTPVGGAQGGGAETVGSLADTPVAFSRLSGTLGSAAL